MSSIGLGFLDQSFSKYTDTILSALRVEGKSKEECFTLVCMRVKQVHYYSVHIKCQTLFLFIFVIVCDRYKGTKCLRKKLLSAL